MLEKITFTQIFNAKVQKLFQRGKLTSKKKTRQLPDRKVWYFPLPGRDVWSFLKQDRDSSVLLNTAHSVLIDIANLFHFSSY